MGCCCSRRKDIHDIMQENDRNDFSNDPGPFAGKIVCFQSSYLFTQAYTINDEMYAYVGKEVVRDERMISILLSKQCTTYPRCAVNDDNYDRFMFRAATVEELAAIDEARTESRAFFLTGDSYSRQYGF